MVQTRRCRRRGGGRGAGEPGRENVVARRKQVVFTLDESALIWLRRIITDRDEAEALKFVLEVLGPGVNESEHPPGIIKGI